MTEVNVPASFQEVLSLKFFDVRDCDAVRNLSSAELEEKLEGFIDECTDGSFKSNLEISSFVYSAITNWTEMTDSAKHLFSKLMCSLAEASIALITDAATTHEKKTSIVYFYYLQQFCLAAEKLQVSKDGAAGKSSKAKPKSKGGDSLYVWAEWRTSFLESMLSLLASPLNKLFPMGIIQENFLTGFWSYPLKLLEERPIGVAGTGRKETETRQQCVNIVARVMTHSSASLESLCAALLSSLMKSEHMCGCLVELCASSAGERLTEIVIGEIGRLDAGSLSAVALKSVGAFLEAFASSSPVVLMKHFPILVMHLDSPAHQVRSAIVQCVGHIIAHIHTLVLQKSAEGEEGPEAKQAAPKSDDEDEEAVAEEPDFLLQNVVQLTNLRNSLIDLLTERVRDTSPYTRTAVLKAWVALLESGAVPVLKVYNVCEIAADRLLDKNALVRKNAAALLTACLDNNPFSGDLDSRLYAQQMADLKAQLAQRMEELRSNLPPREEDEEDDGEPVADEDNEELQADAKADSAVLEIQTKLEVVGAIAKFVQRISGAQQSVVDMLKSKTSGDVTEALQFFSRAINFNIQGAMTCFKTAFALIWHQEPAIKTALLDAFNGVYFTDGAVESSTNLSNAEVAFNLIKLIRSCSDHEIISLEKIVGELLNAGKLDRGFFEAVWSRIVAHESLSGSDDLAAALRLYTVIARCTPGVLSAEHMRTIIRVAGLDQVTEGMDPSSPALKAGIQCILAVPSCLAKKTLSEAALSEAFMMAVPTLVKVLLGDYCANNEADTKVWFSVCEEAVHALFHIHTEADKVLAGVLHRMYFTLSKSTLGGKAGNVYELSRFLFLLGQTAIGSLVFTESIALAAKRIAKPSGEAKHQEEKAGSEVDAMEEEMGCAAAADADHDKMLAEVVEQELVVRNLLGKFLPLILFVVADEQRAFAHSLVRETSILTLCRFMATSSVVCEQALPLLFTVLEKEQSEQIRTTVVITLGDLAFRFPNLVEPWTERIYLRLRDKSQTVRYNALMVVTNLVLNDMIKVKGQVSHVVVSLNDPSEPIRELAKLFFIKLSERSNNPVYNILGDIIGNFSQEEYTNGGAALTHAEFQSTMHFLLSFVDKDKQADSLLERLLVRMGLTANVAHRRKLAYCISELTVSDKGVRRMIELVKGLKDALFDAEILDAFRTLLSKAKRVVRTGAADAKSAVTELEALIEAIVNNVEEVAGGEDSAVAQKTDVAQTPAPEAKKAPARKVAARGKKKVESSDDDESSGGEAEEVVTKATTSSRRAVKGRQ